MKIGLQILRPLNRVQKNLKAVAVLFGPESCPLGMLGTENVALGVGHQTKDAASGITYPGNVMD